MSMVGVHPVSHVFMLRKYIRELEVKIEDDPIIIQSDLRIDSQLVHVLEFSECLTGNCTIKYINILWSN
jgi:hypothetical protein